MAVAIEHVTIGAWIVTAESWIGAGAGRLLPEWKVQADIGLHLYIFEISIECTVSSR